MNVDGAVMTMAKKKRPTLGRPPEPEPTRGLALLRGTPAFEQWLEELLMHSHLVTKPTLLKNALRVYAEHIGFTKTQPPR